MVNDRGSIKWTSMMLPEHVELLKDLWKTDDKIKKPVIDSQQMEEINYQLLNAHQENKEITITIFQQSNLIHHTGNVMKIDPLNKSMVFQLNKGNEQVIHFDQILSVNE